MVDRRQTTGVLTELALYAVSALISFALLNNVLKKLDPNQQNAKQARARLRRYSGDTPRRARAHRGCRGRQLRGCVRRYGRVRALRAR